MHTHVSGTMIVTTFLGVLIIGSLWRITAGIAASSANPTVASVGKAMAFQY